MAATNITSSLARGVEREVIMVVIVRVLMRVIMKILIVIDNEKIDNAWGQQNKDTVSGPTHITGRAAQGGQKQQRLPSA